MYNGIGVMSARGTGTSGFVQRNTGFMKHDHNTMVKSQFDLSTGDKQLLNLSKKTDQKLLDHEKKRAVESALADLEDSSGTLSCFSVSILPQIGCLCIRDFSKESEHFLG